VRPADQEALVAERLWGTRRLLEAILAGDAAAIEEARAAERALQERTSTALARGAVLPIAWPRRRLALTDTEEQVLWLLLAHELSPDARRALRALDTEGLADVSLDVLRRVVHGGRADLRAWRELAPGGTLQRACLIERTGSSDAPAHRTAFRVARRVLALAHGDAGIDEELAGVATRSAGALPLDQLELDPDVRDRLRACLVREGLAILQGRPGAGRRSAWLAAAREAGRELLVIDGRALARERGRAERQLRVAARECRMLELAPLILHLDALADGGGAPDRLGLVDAELGGLVLATAERVPARRWRRQPAPIVLSPPGGAALARLWRRALPAVSTGDAELLAKVYPLAPALIRTAGAMATRAAAGATGAAGAAVTELQPVYVETGVRAVLDDRLADLATRIPVTRGWMDLVLPDDATTALIELIARVRARRRVHEDWGFTEPVERGPGVAALFSGPPGTGKTMCAGLVARELGKELYRVDSRRLASARTGEIERNLAALFDAAEAGNVLLLFDEADAILARRAAPELRARHRPRWGSLGASCLIEHLERFSGVCIFATRHEAAIGEALRRRISVHVRFPVPDVEERERLWRQVLAARVPVAGELRLGELARRYAMSGGHIRNAALRAAFLAADASEPITAELLAHATRLEHEAVSRGL
jgi:hypothetical protein